MALHWPTFFTRLASAIVFSVIMMVGLLWNQWAFLVLISLIDVLCLIEFLKMAKKIYHDSDWPNFLLPALIIYSLVLIWFPPVAAALQGLPPTVALQQFLPPLLVGLPLIFLSTILPKHTALKSGVFALAALAYITVPALMLYTLRVQSLLLPLALILLIWMNDTMAYLVGSFIGKHAFSSISPKKTWEGTIGGAVLTLALAIIWGWKSQLFHIVDWVLLALIASVAGTAGDLLESKLKRLAHMKDSGKIMPGHGGALDRFDSLLVAVPFAFFYAWLFMEALPIKVF
ncbi:MAG: phosphatidate cytidylyltransferase [Bacteroidetes bacterium]|nr:phosphatidate cytidylyltransferase [Bacteroidota bacterium]